jgi:hypothetical protein
VVTIVVVYGVVVVVSNMMIYSVAVLLLVCNGVVYSVLVLLVVGELPATITGRCLGSLIDFGAIIGKFSWRRNMHDCFSARQKQKSI